MVIEQMSSQKSLLVIGISGTTCAGKTTTATELCEILPNCKIFTQDDYFLDVQDSRHTWIPELNHINYDILSSLDMEKMHTDIVNYIAKHEFTEMTTVRKSVQNGLQMKELAKNIYNKLTASNVHILIIEGFSIFNYKPLVPLFDLKYYLTIDRDECYRRRLNRIYDPPDCPGYFEKCAWPEHLAQKDEVLRTVENITYFDEYTVNVLEKILLDIYQCS